MEGVYSSRALEKTCIRNINFMWLLQEQKAPEYNAIDRFRREHLAYCIKTLWCQYKVEAFIKPATYKKSKTKKFKNDIIKRENMNYNEYKDYYFCAAGKKILLKGTKT